MPVVLHVGPLDPARGGIASVISALSQDPTWSSRGWTMSAQNTYASPTAWGTFMTLLRAIRMAARPLSVDVVHIHASRGLSLVRKLAVATAVRGRCPVIVQLHSSVLLTPGLAHGWELHLWRRLADRADFILCLTDEAVQRIAFELPPERRASVASVRNPSTDCGVVALDSSIADHPILFLGRLGEGKGVDTLITALSLMEHTSTHLQLAGDGEIDVWVALARQLGVNNRCEFLGWVDVAERRRLMSGACILALPSRTEALPMSVIEAMAAGLPVVSTRVGGIPSLLTDGESGLLVLPDDPEALAEALDRLSGDEDLAIRLSSVARAIYEEELTPTKVITQLILVYDTVTKRPRRH